MKHKQQSLCLKHAYILSYLLYMLHEIVPRYIDIEINKTSQRYMYGQIMQVSCW